MDDIKHFRTPSRQESVSLDDFYGDYFTGGFADDEVYGCNGFRLMEGKIIYHSTFLTPETRGVKGLWTAIFCGRVYLQKKILGDHADTKIIGTIPYTNVNTTIQFLKDLGWTEASDVYIHTTPHNWVGEAIKLETTYGELCERIVDHVQNMEAKFDLNYSKVFGVTI